MSNSLWHTDTYGFKSCNSQGRKRTQVMDKNFIYSKLVHDDDDIIGMIAYGIYKKHKIEFIESIKKAHGREPNSDEWHAFAISTNTSSQLGKYISQAETMLATFVMDTAGEQIKDAEHSMLEQYQANIKSVLPSNLKTVLLGVLGSFIFSIVITIALILGAFSEKDKANMVNKMVTEPVENVQNQGIPSDSVPNSDQLIK